MEKRIQEILKELKTLQGPLFLSKAEKRISLEKELRILKGKLFIEKYRK